MIIDLHMHSHYSPDGRHSIPELLDFFSEGDIAGLTDHETIGGWREFEGEAKNKGINPVLGIEWFSVKCHILAYFLNGVPEKFCECMRERRSIEKNCMRLLYQTFKERFPQLEPYDEVLKLRAHPENILGKPALSEAVAEAAGIDRTQAEDMVREEKNKIPFNTLPKPFYPFNTRPTPFYPKKIIEKILEWDAVPVLAHPYRNFGGRTGRQNKKDVEKKIRELFEFGIRGLDVYSWNSNQFELDHLIGLCDELKLVPIIGSDFHHENKGLSPNDLKAIDKSLKKRVEKWARNGIAKTS